MELRRALLLFTIVLGMAAIATSLARPPDRAQQDGDTPPRPRSAPTAKPRPNGARVASINFSVTEPKLQRLKSGQAATVSVIVPKPGQVELRGLGLIATADELTPARFEVLERRPGMHRIRFVAAPGGTPQSAGTLKVVR